VPRTTPLLRRAQALRAAERARQASADTGNAGEVATDADIVRILRRKASKGDVNAARELREWRDREAATMQGDGWMYVLTPEQRHTLRGWIADGLARAE
jgi:hypothetical protein